VHELLFEFVMCQIVMLHFLYSYSSVVTIATLSTARVGLYYGVLPNIVVKCYLGGPGFTSRPVDRLFSLVIFVAVPS
jgi:hypothetical protein